MHALWMEFMCMAERQSIGLVHMIGLMLGREVNRYYVCNNVW